MKRGLLHALSVAAAAAIALGAAPAALAVASSATQVHGTSAATVRPNACDPNAIRARDICSPTDGWPDGTYDQVSAVDGTYGYLLRGTQAVYFSNVNMGWTFTISRT